MKEKKKIDRREFLKVLGVGAAATTAALYGCKPKGGAAGDIAAVGEVPTDRMTCRTTPTTGDRVSLLGYGCMRWPTRAKSDGSGDEIDQQAVNELVDYAIAHGVNYFDTYRPMCAAGRRPRRESPSNGIRAKNSS